MSLIKKKFLFFYDPFFLNFTHTFNEFSDLVIPFKVDFENDKRKRLLK